MDGYLAFVDFRQLTDHVSLNSHLPTCQRCNHAQLCRASSCLAERPLHWHNLATAGEFHQARERMVLTKHPHQAGSAHTNVASNECGDMLHSGRFQEWPYQFIPIRISSRIQFCTRYNRLFLPSQNTRSIVSSSCFVPVT